MPRGFAPGRRRGGRRCRTLRPRGRSCFPPLRRLARRDGADLRHVEGPRAEQEIRSGCRSRRASSGFIPARAGRFRRRRPWCPKGPSPRARGREHETGFMLRSRGFIPARAGRRRGLGSVLINLGVHPRARGNSSTSPDVDEGRWTAPEVKRDSPQKPLDLSHRDRRTGGAEGGFHLKAVIPPSALPDQSYVAEASRAFRTDLDFAAAAVGPAVEVGEQHPVLRLVRVHVLPGWDQVDGTQARDQQVLTVWRGLSAARPLTARVVRMRTEVPSSPLATCELASCQPVRRRSPSEEIGERVPDSLRGCRWRGERHESEHEDSFQADHGGRVPDVDAEPPTAPGPPGKPPRRRGRTAPARRSAPRSVPLDAADGPSPGTIAPQLQ